MKTKVITFFQNLPEEKHVQFNEAFQLYRESPAKSEVIERTLNARGYSESALDNLLYDLQKMHGISDVEKVPVHVKVADSSLQDSDEIKAIIETVVTLTPEEYPEWLDSIEGSKFNLDNILDYALAVENETAVEVLKTIIEYSSKSEDTKADFIAFLISELDKKTNAENLFLELKPVFDLSDEELFLWANKRQEESGDVNELLELAIAQNADKATEVLTKAWEYVISSLKDLNKKDINDIDVVTTNDSDIDTVKKLTEEKQILISEKEDLQDEKDELEFEKEELEEENESLKDEIQTLKLAPKIDNVSIRVEFPFLNNTDCPDEFKILIADKITAWNRYLELQEQIADAGLGKTVVSNEDLAILGNEAVKCFDENQKIYDELNAYQTTGKVLGVHPIFRRLQLTREVEIMTPDELHNFKGSSSKYFSDNRKQLAKAVKAKNEERILEINTRVADREVKLALVNKTLGISPK